MVVNNDSNSFLILPDELKMKIFNYLSKDDLKKLTFVYRDFYRLSSDNSFWKKIIVDEYGSNPICNRERLRKPGYFKRIYNNRYKFEKHNLYMNNIMIPNAIKNVKKHLNTKKY